MPLSFGDNFTGFRVGVAWWKFLKTTPSVFVGGIKDDRLGKSERAKSQAHGKPGDR